MSHRINIHYYQDILSSLSVDVSFQVSKVEHPILKTQEQVAENIFGVMTLSICI